MKLIAAVDENWGIGYRDELLARIPADLKRFKALTSGHPVLLGRKTLETFPGKKPLPGRRNLILSANPGFRAEGAEVCPTLAAALAAAPEDTFVIGGESVYKLLLPYCDTAYITKLAAKFPADRHLPDLDREAEWYVAAEEPPLEHEGLSFQFATYKRKL